jgi:hypothetical protein
VADAFPVLDREAARSFLQYLDPGTEQFTFQTFTDSEQRKCTYQKHPETGQPIDPLVRVLHGTLDQHWAALLNASRQGAGVFVVINKTTLRGRRSRDNITAVRAYFSDCDGVPQGAIKAGLILLGLMPHIVTQTSRLKYHIFFGVDDAPLSDFAKTQRRLATLLQSDPHVSDLPRVMRLPGFPHQKDGSAGELVRLLRLHDASNYSNADFQAALTRALESREQAKPRKKARAGSGNPPPDWSQGVAEGQRNIECARRAGAAISGGATFEEALERCLRWNALNNPPLSDDEVRAVVASIWETHARNHTHAADEVGRDEKRECKQSTWAILKNDWVYVTAQEVFIHRGDAKTTMYSVKAFGNMFAYLKRDP